MAYSIDDIRNKACPECGCTTIRLEGTVYAWIDNEGDRDCDIDAYTFESDSGECECNACSWSGEVDDLGEAEDEEDNRAA